MKKTGLIFTVLFLFLTCICFPQSDSLKTDSLKKANSSKKILYRKAKTATLMSLCLPGLGQAYNKKYWKIPIIYGGIGGFGYMAIYNNEKYKYYRSALLYSIDYGGYAQVSDGLYSTEDLLKLKVQYKKYRDFGIIGACLIYLLNIVDANVDGHLKTFDVSDNLSIHVDPWMNSNGFASASGLSVKLNFR